MGKEKKILLVDDESEVTHLLTSRLNKRGYVAASVGNGEDALDYLQSNSVDVVVMDVKMPGMGGMAALEQMAASWQDMPIIMLSGHADMQTAVTAMQKGAFGYLMKPVDFDDLLYKIEDACAQANLEMPK